MSLLIYEAHVLITIEVSATPNRKTRQRTMIVLSYNAWTLIVLSFELIFQALISRDSGHSFTVKCC